MKKLVRQMVPVGMGAIILGLTAHSGREAQAPAQTQKESVTNDKTVEGEKTGNSEKPGLVFWELPYGPADTYEPALQKILDKYNSEDHSVTVRLQMLSWSGFMEQYQTSIAAGSSPDTTSSISHRIANWAEVREVLDATDIVEKWKQDGDEILDDSLSGTLEIGMNDGKYYAFPYVTNTITVYYRTDILEDELGFKDLDKPVSREQLFEVCEAIKEKYDGEVIPFSFCTPDQNSSNATINVLLSNGISWMDSGGKQGALDDPKALESMELFQKMKDNGYFPDGMVTYNQADLEKLHQLGKVAMVWNTPALHVAADKKLVAKTKMVGPAYGPSADKPRCVMRIDGVMGLAQTKYLEGTKEFLEWSVKNSLGILTEGYGGLSLLRKSSLEDPFSQGNWEMSEYSKYSDYYEDITWSALFGPATADRILMENIIEQPEEALLMGSTDQTGDLKKAQEALNKIFDEYNSNRDEWRIINEQTCKKR